MRIDMLAHDNTRTQGAARRAHYRRISPDHLRESAALVESALAARDPAAPKQALVLGAGGCTEIPLEGIARVCDTVTLVDLDARGMERAGAELPASLRPRLHVLVADLTGGVSSALATLVRTQPWDDLVRLTPTAPLDAAATCLDRCPVPDPLDALGLTLHGYGLVVSSLVLTQLFSLPLLDVLDTLLLRAPAAADLRDEYLPYREAAIRFRRRVALAHLDLVAGLLAPDGAAVLSTDVGGHLLPPSSGPHASDPPESLRTLPPDVLDLDADVRARFNVLGSVRQWQWLVTPPTATAPGRRFDVAGLLLRAFT
jgi:hypothetical protein